MASAVDAHLEITPANALEFELSKEEATTKVVLTLTHPDKDSPPIAFKVCVRCIYFIEFYVIILL